MGPTKPGPEQGPDAGGSRDGARGNDRAVVYEMIAAHPDKIREVLFAVIVYVSSAPSSLRC